MRSKGFHFRRESARAGQVVRERAKTLLLALLALALLSFTITLAVFATSFFLESFWNLLRTWSLTALANLFLALTSMVVAGGAVFASLLLVLYATGQPKG